MIGSFAAWIALGSAVVMTALAFLDLLIPAFRFWPPPSIGSWQSRTFRALFRLMVYGALIGSATHVWNVGWSASGWWLAVATGSLLTGFVVALLATGALGWRNAFGAKEGLQTQGIFAHSRNPIYLATFFGLVGWALLVASPMIVATLGLWVLLYVIAVFLEERWLAAEYGEAFAAYCRKTRRFI